MADLTDTQVREFARLYGTHWYRDGIEALREAGWTIEPPPDPRYFVRRSNTQAFVGDRHDDGRTVATFWRTDTYPNEMVPAEALCARLNAEHGGGS